MKILINYADGCCFESRRKNTISGLYHGFDSVTEWKREHIDTEFLKSNAEIMNSSRGAGYWLWKPYIIRQTMNRSNDGDIIFYSDAASYFIKPMNEIFLSIEENGIVCFEMSGHHTEGRWTRSDVIRELGFDLELIKNTEQRMASFIGLVNNEYSRNIIDEYLSYCSRPELIMDIPNSDDQLPEFIEHRHDQSIWSLLTKKHNIHMLKDPTQWGITHKQTNQDDMYIMHTRDKR